MTRTGLIATKIGNSSFFNDDGGSTQVTVLKVEDCIVSNIKLMIAQFCCANTQTTTIPKRIVEEILTERKNPEEFKLAHRILKDIHELLSDPFCWEKCRQWYRESFEKNQGKSHIYVSFRQILSKIF